MRWAFAMAVVACGRTGFDTAGDTQDAPVGDALADVPGSMPDANPNSITRTYGLRTGVDVVAPTSDTFISNEAGESLQNNGGADVLRSEQDVSEHILLRFDLAAIPVSAQVVAASVTIRIVQFDPSATLSAHPLLERWTEGTGDGTAGVANFIDRDTNVPWTTIGAGSPGSSSSTPIGSAMPTAAADLSMSLSPPAVQAWVSAPAQNFGMIFFNSSSQSVRFASSEESAATQRPMLTITYVP
jgi:hypothetical protein